MFWFDINFSKSNEHVVKLLCPPHKFGMAWWLYMESQEKNGHHIWIRNEEQICEICLSLMLIWCERLLYPPNNEVVGGYIGFTPSVRPSVRLSVRPSVCPSRLPCPLCNIYTSGWILSILVTNDHYHERVCRTQWPLTLTYIFKVIWPWLRKSCPLCSVYSSGWILFIFSTNDHYH